MDALWNFFTKFAKFFGLAVIGLAILGGLINGVIWMTRDFWLGFYGMLSTWVFGIWLGMMLILMSKITDNTRGA